jgi:hypothetical protein
MTHKRSLRKRVHALGSEAGRALVEWLNREGSYRGTKRTAAHRRIEGLFDEWRFLTRLPVSYWGSEEWRRFNDLQRNLGHYRMSPQIDAKRMSGSGMRFVWNPGSSKEAKAVLIMTWLGERALLWRVRRCGHGTVSTSLRTLGGLKPECGKWFYARRKDQQFCSPACRRRSYAPKARTPEGRAKRAAYMRKRRAAQRESEDSFFAASRMRKPDRRGNAG